MVFHTFDKSVVEEINKNLSRKISICLYMWLWVGGGVTNKMSGDDVSVPDVQMQ